MFTSSGKLKLKLGPQGPDGYIAKSQFDVRIILPVDFELARYYRNLIPKHIIFNKPRYDPHITVILEKKNDIDLNIISPFYNQEIEFQYSEQIRLDHSSNYIVLPARSPQLEEIRVKCGLPVKDWYTQTSDGQFSFHITIGNTKL